MRAHSNPHQRTLNSLFKSYLDVVHIKLGLSGTLSVKRSADGDRIPGLGGVGDVSEDDEDRAEMVSAQRESDGLTT